ncbi:hypothetical protein, conserved [Babesia ovata]|uniref:6-Cys domain-containing protein n=1 Tax=Babesia ovata TaxID=189622 RepID=A0A2H6KGZ7_9APIC|nr:uncharacterized protein BOVATA_037580 [Babesia ovata]GBE62265.1 hypothetical protein, conserved [Babesia ovata]
MRYLWACCTIVVQFVIYIDAAYCDFDHPHGSLASSALVRCDMDIDDIASASAICPRQINNTEYVWHPRSTLDEQAHINTYVGGNGRITSVAISDVVHNDSSNKLIWVESNQSDTELHFNKPADQFVAITEHRLIFICGPKDFVLSDALQRHIDRLNDFSRMQALPWTSTTPLAHEMSRIGRGMGLLFMNRGRQHLPLQGCGSRPSPLFAPDNEVTVDPITGTRSCVADPMSKSRIGFLCEGRLEPDDCMRSLLDKNGGFVTAHPPHRYWKIDNHRPWVVAQYFEKLAFQPFNGECKCIDPETGQVKARIEIRSKTEYICDIASKVFRDRYHPIRGPWCSVVLHPGSTLTIKLPTKIVDLTAINKTFHCDSEGDIDGGFTTVPFSQLPSIYEYESEFLPKDMTTLRQLKSIHDINAYDEIPYHEALVGDALELDVSRMSLGEVKVKYLLGKPLTSISGVNSFLYHWTLMSRNENVLDKIRAAINVSFAFTHSYMTVGCDRGPHSVFDLERNDEYCVGKQMGNGVGTTYECLYRKMWNVGKVGIHCRADEQLLPNNCDSIGYDLYLNGMVPFPESMISAIPYSHRGFQLLDFDLNDDDPLSYACICVDQRGYERSKLILESNRKVKSTFVVRREKVSHTLTPYTLLPWSEVGVLDEGLSSYEHIVMHHAVEKSIALQVGTTLLMTCGIGFVASSAHRFNNGKRFCGVTVDWLPYKPEEFYYTVSHASHGRKLMRTPHKDTIGGTPGGLEIRHQEFDKRPGYKELAITSRRGAILISKDPLHKKHLPMTFVCCKYPKPSDMSVITGEISASAVPHITETSARYTWHLVQVAVETTDPYMQGCGVTYLSTELFRPETPKLYYPNIRQPRGCKIDLKTAGEAAFYCPAPYVLDPPNCFSQVLVDGTVKNINDLSQSLVASRSNHFVILSYDSSLIGQDEKLRHMPPLQCRCVTIKGVMLSTIQIENYYSK